MKFFLATLLLIFTVGCSNFSQVSELENACFPDGSCTFVGTYMNGGIIAGKQVVVVNVKECKKFEAVWKCTNGEKTVSIGDGMAEKMLSGAAVYTRHSGKAYNEGDTINSSGSGSGTSSSNSTAAAASASSSVSGNNGGGGEH